MHSRRAQRRAVVAIVALGLGIALLWLIGLLWLPAPAPEHEPQPAAPLETAFRSADGAEPARGLPPAPAPSPPESLTPTGAADPLQPIAALVAPAGDQPVTTATLELRLLQPDGLPAAAVEVNVEPLSQLLHDGQILMTDDRGELVIEVPASEQISVGGEDFEVLRLFRLSLAPGEHRVHIETLKATVHPVEVHVREPSGAAAVGTVVLLTATRHDGERRTVRSTRSVTGAEGRVRWSLAADSITIGAWRTGFAPAWLLDTPTNGGPLVIELTLDRGRTVEVDVVDAAGRPHDVDAIEMSGAPIPLHAERLAVGLYRFAALPEGQISIVATDQRRHWFSQHDTREARARLVVPLPGELSVSWPSLQDCQHPRLFLRATSGAWAWNPPVEPPDFERGGPVVIRDLVPETYSVELRCTNDDSLRLIGTATVTSEARTSVVLRP